MTSERPDRMDVSQQAKLRRQHRALRREQDEQNAARERQQHLIARRCAEMQHEEMLSAAAERALVQEAARRHLEQQREEAMRVFRATDAARRRAQVLGVSMSTPGLSGPQRLQELQARIEAREAALVRAAAAKQRLDALPAERSARRQRLTDFATSSLQKKVERAVFDLRCERFASLFGPSESTCAEQLVDHESANGFTPVLAAICCGKLSELRRLLEFGASPDAETSSGMTPLLMSVMTDDVVALSILVEFKANVDRETRHFVRPLHLAADKGRLEIVKALLRSGASVNAPNGNARTPLMQAVLSNQFEAVKILLAFGADKTVKDLIGQTALQWANKLGFAHIASLLSSSVSSAILHTQVVDEEEEENQGIAITATSAARLPSTRRARMLEAAMRERNLARMRQLLEDSSFSPNYEDRCGDTPFLIACEFGSCADILFCLDKKAIPTHQNRFGRNGVMAASYHGDTATLELLIKTGLSLQTRDFKGWDSFRHLGHYEHPDVVEQLMKMHRTSAETPPFMLGDPLPTTAMLCSARPTAIVHLPVTSSDPETSYNIGVEPFESTASASSENDGDGDGRDPFIDGDDLDDGDSVDNPASDPAIHKWGARQLALKKDRGRRIAFDIEREQILRATIRGRRHGLVAPLPGDPAGRKKFPTCDNCKGCRARKRCAQCDQVLCDKCHARLHELAQRRHHQFDELEPEVYVGHELRETVVERHVTSLKHLTDRSIDQVVSMQAGLLNGTDVDHRSSSTFSSKQHSQEDPEIERFNRTRRLAREKQVMQMQINVPVASAKHAAREGEASIFTNPAEIELANLYIVQKKYEKAKELLEQTRTLVSESLGELHPTMLKISIGFAKIQMETGHPEACVQTIRSALALFESVLSPEHADLVVSVAVLLAGLVRTRQCFTGVPSTIISISECSVRTKQDTQARYNDAVSVCKEWLRLRSLCLSDTHESVQEMRTRLDEFVSKRESIYMTHEDQIYLEMNERNIKHTAQQLRDQERRLNEFRHLLLEDPSGRAEFLQFARKEFADDMVTFWIAVEEFKKEGDPKVFRAKAIHIFLTYIKSRRVKIITAVQRKKIKKTITTPGRKLPTTVYDEVQNVLFDVVYNGIYVRYLASRGSSESTNSTDQGASSVG